MVPEDFRVLPKIKRILLERRLQIWKAGGPYNWSFAEALAFGSFFSRALQYAFRVRTAAVGRLVSATACSTMRKIVSAIFP
jgi:2-oxoglutarate dehydrogenase complex dehydrogenase (E1) component-like enzyme